MKVERRMKSQVRVVDRLYFSSAVGDDKLSRHPIVEIPNEILCFEPGRNKCPVRLVPPTQNSRVGD